MADIHLHRLDGFPFAIIIIRLVGDERVIVVGHRDIAGDHIGDRFLNHFRVIGRLRGDRDASNLSLSLCPKCNRQCW